MEKECVVAYIDILGFSQMMLSDDPDLRSNVIKLLVQLNSLSSKYGVESRSHGFASIITCNPELSTFSDNIVISAPIEVVHKENPLGIQTFITNIISLIVSTVWEGLHRGILFRGAVTMGRLYHQQNVVAGKGLLDAIELEGNTTYPRIEVHKSVLDATDNKGKPLVDDYTRKSSIKESDDGYYINSLAYHVGVWGDYFYFRNQEYDPLKIPSAVQAMRDLITSKIMELRSMLLESDINKQEEVARWLEKWEWLKEEFDARQQDESWQQALSN